MAHIGLVVAKPPHAMDAEILRAIEAARLQPRRQPRLFLGVLNERGDLYRYVRLDGHSQGRHLKDRLRELGLLTERDRGVLRVLGTL
jgi:hypothetical protein